MVRGSGHDPVTSETKRFLYNGTIEQWDACKMHIRSVLHQKGLWRVTKEGPKNEPPTYGQPIDAGEYYYALQDNITQGPVDAQRVLHILKCFREIGNLNPDTIMIYHRSVTNDQWEKWSEQLHNKIALPIALAEHLHTRLSSAASESTIRLPSPAPTLAPLPIHPSRLTLSRRRLTHLARGRRLQQQLLHQTTSRRRPRPRSPSRARLTSRSARTAPSGIRASLPTPRPRSSPRLPRPTSSMTR